MVFILRGLVAFRLPLTGDEAYYWEWSRHLALGYVDHPPATAFLIAAFTTFGNAPGFVRLGFVLCGVVAAVAASGAATILAKGDPRAGAVAALVLTVTPLASPAFGTASPDGPYLMFWCTSLYFAARAFSMHEKRDWLFLGIALGGVLLSRIFGFALLFGLIVYALAPKLRHVWREGFAITLCVATLMYMPFLLWNAAHHWVTFTFAFIHRHEGEHGSLRNLLALYEAQAGVYSPGIFAAVFLAALRPCDRLLAWTALPLCVLLTLLALFCDVEMYWIWGAFASLCVMLGVAYVRLTPEKRIVWTIVTMGPGLLIMALFFLVALAPAVSYRWVYRETGIQLHDAGPFEIFAFAPLAHDVERIARDEHAVVMTDGYGLSSVLDFNAGLPPIVIGYDWQGREARSWYVPAAPVRRALFVDKVPLRIRPDFQRQLGKACARTADGGVHAYAYGGTPPRNFYFTWCEAPRPSWLAILRWEQQA
jgi:Dolichyl-phosphate-mannose-protein mannosyltransferase